MAKQKAGAEKTEPKLKLRRLTGEDAELVLALSNAYGADVFDYSLREVQRMLSRPDTVGYRAVLQTKKGEGDIGIVFGYPTTSFSDVWKKTYAPQGLPAEYVGEDKFCLEALITAPEIGEGGAAIAGALLSQLDSDLSPKVYREMVSVSPLGETGFKPSAVGFKRRGKVEHFWVYDDVNEPVTVWYRQISSKQPQRAEK